jgi:AcrR family transcriptional regulator
MSTSPKELAGNRAREWSTSEGEPSASAMIAMQRGRMLTAMMEVCAERGVAGATVAHVVGRSGVSRRTFYEAFEDREDCFLAAFDQAVEQAAGRVLDVYDAEDRWSHRIRVGLVALLSFLEDEPAAGRLLVVESLGGGPRALERRSQTLAVLIAAIDAGREEARTDANTPPLAAEGVVGAVCAVLHARLCGRDGTSLIGLVNQLMSMIVLPYLGPAAARRELERPLPRIARRISTSGNPLKQLEMRLTYRTVRVLMAVASTPGSSNRKLADAAGVADPGQISKLLARLYKLGLIENAGGGNGRGEPNAWMLTEAGWRVQNALLPQAAAN